MMKIATRSFALFALALLAAVPCSAEEPARAPMAATETVQGPSCEAGAVQVSSGYTFWGCFTYFPAGPCRDVFRDSSGQLWICGACGTTKKPPQGCSKLTGSGYWCS